MTPRRPHPRDDLRALEGYHSPLHDVDVRLNRNDRPFAPSREFIESLSAALRDVELPPESTIVVVIRNGAAFFPNGATVLEPGDEVVALTRNTHEPRLRSLFFGA